MAEDHVAEHPADVGDVQARESFPRVDKATVKEALSDLLSEILAFHELTNLPGPSSEGGTYGLSDVESPASVNPSPGPGELLNNTKIAER